ncbi:uncharacterized protein BJX67DRAFT_353455 [Aspergillus lucknowensis]|uniref:Uncharacterized protein n=1 Tax=Aspergillus lucknowensis TaxID=176173 RepID=A0ABR4LRR0_9EURO
MNNLMPSIRLSPVGIRLLLVGAEADRAVVAVSFARFAFLAGPDSVFWNALWMDKVEWLAGLRATRGNRARDRKQAYSALISATESALEDTGKASGLSIHHRCLSLSSESWIVKCIVKTANKRGTSSRGRNSGSEIRGAVWGCEESHLRSAKRGTSGVPGRSREGLDRF